MKRVSSILGILLGFILLVQCSFEEKKDAPQSSIGATLPFFSLKTNDQKMFTFKDSLEKPLLLIFFKTTCPDCQNELPILQAFFEKYNHKISFLALSREEEAIIQAFWKNNHYTIPFCTEPKGFNMLRNKLSFDEIPTLFLVNKRGEVVWENKHILSTTYKELGEIADGI